MDSILKAIRKFIPQSAVNTFWHLPVAILANFIYGFPSKNLVVVGVTGTDGKTTTTSMIYQILKNAGKNVSVISTVNAIIGKQVFDTGFHVTSPHPLKLQKLLKQALNEGCEYVVLEVTSNGLDQHRFWGIKFEVGVITNITQDHLDYHKTLENYILAKAKLAQNSKIAVLNYDDENFFRLKTLTNARVVSFGLTKKADFNPKNFPLKIKLPGQFNLSNALAASAASVSLGILSEIIKEALSHFESVEGRMEEIKNNLGVKIIIDFAHTPNALENSLKTLRSETRGNLIAVFGCAGLRDESKRPLMGKIAADLADYVIITAEDPRGLIYQINEQILKGVKKAGGKLGENIFVENDRLKAIKMAVSDIAKKGDTVGIFGKGHEESMNLDGDKEIPWSDKKAVTKILYG